MSPGPEGGAPVLPYGRQLVDEDDVAAVVEALRSAWLTTGPRVAAFEEQLAAVCGAAHAVAVSSGTAALHVAMLAAGIGPGQRVVTSPNTFLASANAAVYVGATPDFADIDPRTGNLAPAALEGSLAPDVRAVVPVDFAGQPCDLPRIAELARERGALVIEDASHALGAGFEHARRSYRVGGHPFADLTVLSFHPVKAVTTGEGGAILTGDPVLAERCRVLRSHGVRREPARFEGLGDPSLAERGPWYQEMQELGFNYRLTDLQCALGRSQLAKLPRFLARRREIAVAYDAAFTGLAHVTTPEVAPGVRSAWHLYVLQIDFAALGRSRTRVMEALRERGVGSQVHYIPVHLQPWYRKRFGYGPGKCPAAERHYARCLSLPLYPALCDDDVARVVAAVREVLRA